MLSVVRLKNAENFCIGIVISPVFGGLLVGDDIERAIDHNAGYPLSSKDYCEGAAAAFAGVAVGTALRVGLYEGVKYCFKKVRNNKKSSNQIN